MNTGLTLRERSFLGITEAATRRLQTGVWLAVLLLAVALNVVMLPNLVDGSLELSDMNLDPAERDRLRQNIADMGISVKTFTIAGLIGSLIQESLVVVISAVLLRKRKSADWFSFYLSLTMIAGIAAMYPPVLRDMVGGQSFWVVIGMVMTSLSVTSLFLIPFLFPTGRFAPRLMAVPALVIVVQVCSFVISPGDDAGGDLDPVLEALFNLGLLALIAGSVVYRYRKTATPVQRQQVKWGTAGAAIAVPTFLLGDALMRSIDGSFRGMLAMIGWSIAMPVASLAFPLCLTVAILKYRLWDIDLYLSRTLVWVLMTVLVIAAYVGIVFGIGSQLRGDQSTVLSLIALGLTAVLFEPVRQHVQLWITRLFFGDRDDPYHVVRQLTTDLAETVLPVEALHAIVHTLTEALRLPYAAITLDPGASPVAIAGNPGSIECPFPLVYQSQPVGELIVSPRGGTREFDATDRHLLDDLARQIGVVAHNLRLTKDLQHSRERIVNAREEERRRLRRDLHDGLGAQLAALSLQATAMKSAIRTDPDLAVEQATELQHELRTAIADIRRLVQGLRPASLDDLGLLGALQNRIATINYGEGTPLDGPGLSVSLDAPAGLGNLPAAVEVAIYRIVDEALTNVVRHAGADRCTIRIARSGSEIRLTVEDNGAGIPADRVSGVGLQSMRERALELGGSFEIASSQSNGVRIVVTLPITGGGR